MLRACDAVINLVEEELPALVYAEATPVLVRQVAEQLLDQGLATVDEAQILAAAQSVGFDVPDTVTLERRPEGFCPRLLLTLSAAEAMPLSLLDLDRLLSALVAAHLQLELPRSLEQAVRALGLICRGDLPPLEG